MSISETIRSLVAQTGVGRAAAIGEIEINDEFDRALQIVERGDPFVFVTGGAGTGKTTFIRCLREATEKRLVVVAPTGVAALNIEGQTIHSFCRFPPRQLDPDTIPRLRNRTVYEKLEILVIDEISMVRADLLDAIDVFLRKNREASDQPFGGVQVVAVGDLYQLPPVVATEEETEYIQSRYESPYFFSADCLCDLEISGVELTRVYRQEDDEFVRMLDGVRLGGAGSVDAIEEINNSCREQEVPSRGQIILTCTNAQAERLNAAQLLDLDGTGREYQGELEGRFGVQKQKLPAPQSLVLKPGAQVMFTKNDADERWVNGTLGTVETLHDDAVEVSIKSKGTCLVELVVWESYAYSYDRQENKLLAEAVGRYKQLPLMLAWAVTIHKSQGQTLEDVLLDFGWGAFAHGQVYVALSRCCTLEGLALRREITADDLVCDRQVQEFYSKFSG